jgi:hypothetical protein
MNRLFVAVAIVAATTAVPMTVPAQAADVGVSVRIGEPGFYGQLELGNVGHPSVINSRPSLIKRAPHGAVGEPLYLRVPASHRNNWSKYCAHYGACDHPVYFVKDDWYNKVYAPHYREQHREDGDDNNRNNRDNRDTHGDSRYHGEDNDHSKGRDHG